WAARSARRAARSSDELLRRAYAERTTRPLTTIAAFLNRSLHELLDQRLRQLACALVAAGDACQGAAVRPQPQRAARLLVHRAEASKPREHPGSVGSAATQIRRAVRDLRRKPLPRRADQSLELPGRVRRLQRPQQLVQHRLVRL